MPKTRNRVGVTLKKTTKMRFQVKFISASGRAISMGYQHIGWDHYEKLKIASGCQFLDLNLVQDIISPIEETPEINFSIEEIQESAHLQEVFSKKSFVTVKVNRFINEFLVVKPFIERDSQNGAIIKAGFAYAVDEEALKNAWLQAGCPLEWRLD
jgi:hypothetical protein